MITEKHLLGWNNIPVKSKEVIYPQSKDDKAPKNCFSGIHYVVLDGRKKLFIY